MWGVVSVFSLARQVVVSTLLVLIAIGMLQSSAGVMAGGSFLAMARNCLWEMVMDGIHCAHLLEHLPDPERAFMEYHRVLRDGGVLLVRVPPFDASFYDDWSHVRPFTKKSLLRLAAVAGYHHTRVFYYHYDLPFRKWETLPPFGS